MNFTQIKHQDAATKTYLGSPSLLRLDDGDLLATHDYFGPGCPRNHEHEEHLLSVYRSRDDGVTWANVTHVAGQYWSSPFSHDGAVYLLGVSQQYGSIVIRRSDDGGNTWTHPRDERSGLLFRGGTYHDNPNYHCAPVPVLVKDGWLYRAFEDCRDARWGTGFESCVIACRLEADLLDAANWIMSNKVPFDRAWLPDDWPELAGPGFLEGNVVETPEGEIWNILRCHSAPLVDKAVVLRVEQWRGRIRDGGRSAGSYPARAGCQTNGGPDSANKAGAMRPLRGEPLRQDFLRLIDFPGGMSKFTIRRDPQTGLYLTISNNNTDPRFPSQRNVLSLHSSEDLIHWRHERTLLEDDLGLPWEDSARLTGFQYVDWQFDGDDIIYAVRTAYDGAHNFHDANRLTFHRLEQWQQVVP